MKAANLTGCCAGSLFWDLHQVLMDFQEIGPGFLKIFENICYYLIKSLNSCTSSNTRYCFTYDLPGRLTTWDIVDSNDSSL